MLRAMVVVALAAATANANPKSSPPPVVGATEVWRVAPTAGFVDDAIASDGKRLAYFVSDGATTAKLHVWSGEGDERVVELAAVALHPIALALVGERAFVVGDDDGKQVAALVDIADHGKKPTGAVIYKLPPADHVTIDKTFAIVHRATATKTGTTHVVEQIDLASGRRVAGGRPLELDAKNANAKLEFRVNHWAAGMSRAIGVKGGEWNKKEDQRSPDVEATYDLVTGRFVATAPITDLFEQHKRYEVLAAAGGVIDFVKPAWDNSELQLWRDGKPKPLALDQPFNTYDPKSVLYVFAPSATWIALKVDPVNPDAVARKKADPEYLDLFLVDGTNATRKARFLAAGARYRFGVHGDKLWLLERSTGFDRGGKSLAVYKLE